MFTKDRESGPTGPPPRPKHPACPGWQGCLPELAGPDSHAATVLRTTVTGHRGRPRSLFIIKSGAAWQVIRGQ
eukprot:755218-Hanusia_phi.AAC.1